MGSTGSIGVQALNIIDQQKNCFDVFLLSCHSNYQLIYSQAIKFKPRHIVVNTEEGYGFLKKNINFKNTTISLGLDSLCDVVRSKEIDFVLSAIVGSAGLLPTISAIKAAV